MIRTGVIAGSSLPGDSTPRSTATGAVGPGWLHVAR